MYFSSQELSAVMLLDLQLPHGELATTPDCCARPASQLADRERKRGSRNSSFWRRSSISRTILYCRSFRITSKALFEMLSQNPNQLSRIRMLLDEEIDRRRNGRKRNLHEKRANTKRDHEERSNERETNEEKVDEWRANVRRVDERRVYRERLNEEEAANWRRANERRLIIASLWYDERWRARSRRWLVDILTSWAKDDERTVF